MQTKLKPLRTYRPLRNGRIEEKREALNLKLHFKLSHCRKVMIQEKLAHLLIKYVKKYPRCPADGK